MFPEYRELISQLKVNDANFRHLFSKHNELDQRVKNMEAHIEPASHEDIESLKKKKLLLKDEIYELLKKASAV
ncbi:MAG: YdcH family protein [Sideroxydans sp.]|nr:YdcH family protein [Sideroxydans sp.]MDD5470434.1 YdcH family protein [Sideroxydans sp.]